MEYPSLRLHGWRPQKSSLFQSRHVRAWSVERGTATTLLFSLVEGGVVFSSANAGCGILSPAIKQNKQFLVYLRHRNTQRPPVERGYAGKAEFKV